VIENPYNDPDYVYVKDEVNNNQWFIPISACNLIDEEIPE
jgi:hypothetical protein